jgi:hypothetical protein
MAAEGRKRGVRLQSLERTLLEVLRHRDPSRRWQRPAPGQKGEQVREHPTGR